MKEILLVLIFGLAVGWTVEETGWTPVPEEEVQHKADIEEKDHAWKSEMWFAHNKENQ